MAMSVGGGGGGRQGRRGRTPMTEINVTPFVDVMLVLLIIFMVTAPLLQAGVPIELPDSRAKALSEERLQVTLTLGSDGALYVDDAPVALSDLPRRLAAFPREAGGDPPLVTLRADTSLDYGSVIAVMGELNRAGFNSISLVTNATAAPPGAQGALSAGSGGEP